MIDRLKCFLGFHVWAYGPNSVEDSTGIFRNLNSRSRKCEHCQKSQVHLEKWGWV